jgi:heme-degrading monooxygenase HmoA
MLVVSHIIVWEFLVREGCEQEFEEAYGPHGAWAILFGKCEEYLGTELLRDATTTRRYLTLDRWKTAEAFVAFKEKHMAEYEALDARSERLTESETKIGTWVVKE